MMIGYEKKLSWSIGIINIYLKYGKIGHSIRIIMYTQGLKSFIHLQMRQFTLKNIKQPYQKKNTDKYVDIDEMKVYGDLSFKKEDIIFKIKKEFIDMLDKINNKIKIITDIKIEIIKIKDKVSKNIQSIFDKIFIKFPDDPQLRLAYLNKVDAEMDDALNFVCNKLCKENKIRSEKINRDKHKDFGRYIGNKLELLERVERLLRDIISEIENKINMIHKDLDKAHNKGINKLHLINDKLKEIMRQLKKDIINRFSSIDLQQK